MAAEKETPTPAGVVQQHSPSALISSEKLGEENLHGDSITVVKHKKQPKSRAKIPSKSGTHDDGSKQAGKVTAMGNKFDALNLENSVKVGHTSFSVGKGGPIDNGPSTVNKKRLLRNKRLRAEPPIIQPKIFGAKPHTSLDSTAYKSVPSGPGETSKPINPIAGKQVIIDAPHKSLPFNIQTSMNVEVVGPNHLRLLDEEDKPSDPINSCTATQVLICVRIIPCTWDDVSLGKRYTREIVRRYQPSFIALFETHCLFHKVEKFWNGLGFKKVHIIEAIGHGGGIWVLIDKECRINVSVHDVCNQAVTIVLSERNQSWVCSFLYASPTPSSRENVMVVPLLEVVQISLLI
ncbi:Endonuclease/exonuclease/phosphatase superfamily [Sesbania bispinosa]|nr:Endonuclease/exonuclease/phosphatase superfamily [Sesbania bispinosa]